MSDGKMKAGDVFSNLEKARIKLLAAEGDNPVDAAKYARAVGQLEAAVDRLLDEIKPLRRELIFKNLIRRNAILVEKMRLRRAESIGNGMPIRNNNQGEPVKVDVSRSQQEHWRS